MTKYNTPAREKNVFAKKIVFTCFARLHNVYSVKAWFTVNSAKNTFQPWFLTAKEF